MTDPDLLPWLRKTIGRTMSAAKIISDGGFAPQRWDTVPPGQVNPEEIPASKAVTAAIGAEPDEVCGWVQIVAYDRLNNEPPEADCRESAVPVILVDDGRRQHEHIVLNDPRNVVARCEAELAILDLYDKTAAIAREPDFLAQGRVAREARARDYLDAQRELCVLEVVVSLVAAGYRHHPGWTAEWGA